MKLLKTGDEWTTNRRLSQFGRDFQSSLPQ